jgi:HSP20 family protein
MSAKEQHLASPQKAEVSRREPQQEYFVPAVDVSEITEALVLRCDMPGVRKEDVDITVEKGTLTLTGKAEPESAGTPMYCETRVGDYRREFALPEDVTADDITAEMSAGVLTIRIGKPEKAKPKRIQIEIA